MSFAPGAAYTLGKSAHGTIRTYGELFEALLRGWHLLPVGLYRRLEPGIPPTPPTVTDPASQFAQAFIYSPPGSHTGTAAFKNDKSLLSYVFTNPPPNTVLNGHDLVYVLRAATESVGTQTSRKDDAFDGGM